MYGLGRCSSRIICTVLESIMDFYMLGRKLIFSLQNVTNKGNPYCQSSALVEINFTCIWMKKCELLGKIPERWRKCVWFNGKLFSWNPHVWRRLSSFFHLVKIRGIFFSYVFSGPLTPQVANYNWEKWRMLLKYVCGKSWIKLHQKE